MTLGAMGMLTAFERIKGPVFKDTIKLAQDLSTVTGRDLKSSIKSLGPAFNDPVKGITLLETKGLSLTESQKKQIKVFQESGNILAAQRILLEGFAHIQGRAAAQALTLGGRIDQLKGIWGDFLELIGKIAVPILHTLLNKIEPIILGWQEWLKNQDDLEGKVQTFVYGTLASLKTALLEVWQYISPVITKIREWASANPELANKIKTFGIVLAALSPILGPLILIALPALTLAFTALTSPLGLIVGAAGLGWALGTWIDGLIDKVPILRKAIEFYYDVMVKVVDKLAEWIGLKEKRVKVEQGENFENERNKFFRENPELFSGKGKAPNHQLNSAVSGKQTAGGGQQSKGLLSTLAGNTYNIFVKKVEDAQTTIDDITNKVGAKNLGKQGRVAVT